MENSFLATPSVSAMIVVLEFYIVLGIAPVLTVGRQTGTISLKDSASAVNKIKGKEGRRRPDP